MGSALGLGGCVCSVRVGGVRRRWEHGPLGRVVLERRRAHGGRGQRILGCHQQRQWLRLGRELRERQLLQRIGKQLLQRIGKQLGQHRKHVGE
jgi:hypothetical protein